MMFSGEAANHRVPGYWVVLVFGFWFLVFGFWFLVFGFWFLVFGFWFLVFGFWFLGASRQAEHRCYRSLFCFFFLKCKTIQQSAKGAIFR